MVQYRSWFLRPWRLKIWLSVHSSLLFWRMPSGAVGISREGEEMISDVDKDALTGKPQRYVHDAGEYYTVSCPWCTDTRKRLYINHRWGLKDPETGSLNLHLAHCFNEGCSAARPVLELYRIDSPFTHELGEDVIKSAHRTVSAPVVQWPGRRTRIKELFPNHPARLYLRPGLRRRAPVHQARCLLLHRSVGRISVGPGPHHHSDFHERRVEGMAGSFCRRAR